jgi:hypothetical protein
LPEAVRLPRRLRKLAAAAHLPDAPLPAVRTASRADTGGWLRRHRLWALLPPGELLLLAPGRRPVVLRIAMRKLIDSVYNHVTGELVLAPADGLAVKALRLRPVEAYQILARIRHEGSNHA